jgi:citrate lyase subunit beta/citryl-CoA lyase
VIHPRDVLLDAATAASLPVCDHYCGVESRMKKSLQLQAEMTQEVGSCVFDVTLDCEDGAPVGAEKDHALMVAALANEAYSASKKRAINHAARIAVRIHPVGHRAFEQDIELILGQAGASLCHVMLPKVDCVEHVERAVQAIDQVMPLLPGLKSLPLHVLIESPMAVQQVASIVAHPRVQSASFGLMDFVSAHGGAIPASAMGLSSQFNSAEHDQFSHPLVVRAKLELVAACHAWGKTPSHCVVTEFKHPQRVQAAARQASRAFGFTRMWSIHPDQIRPILAAFAPTEAETAQASQIILAGHAEKWAPIALEGKLHDRASYRYFWQLLERAHQTGKLAHDDPAHVFF